jgi:EAL domain-containing protein (putative c-di-GMP-specific phosphodiesterase class I)
MALKADRQFVAGLGEHDVDDAIVASVIMLAHAIGAFCVAEGVETLQQQATLTNLHCDYAQGYLYSEPIPANAIRNALQRCEEVLTDPQGLAAQPTAS